MSLRLVGMTGGRYDSAVPPKGAALPVRLRREQAPALQCTSLFTSPVPKTSRNHHPLQRHRRGSALGSPRGELSPTATERGIPHHRTCRNAKDSSRPTRGHSSSFRTVEDACPYEKDGAGCRRRVGPVRQVAAGASSRPTMGAGAGCCRMNGFPHQTVFPCSSFSPGGQTSRIFTHSSFLYSQVQLVPSG